MHTKGRIVIDALDEGFVVSVENSSRRIMYGAVDRGLVCLSTEEMLTKISDILSDF